MARPTVTRAALRRKIGRELSMSFFRRWDTKSGATSDSDFSIITDTDLNQQDGFWTYMWFYNPVTGEMRQISEHNAEGHQLLLEYPLSANHASTDVYEIHEKVNPLDIHDAINRAVRSGFPNFFDMVTDDTLVLQEDRLEYGLDGLAVAPWIISGVFIEQNSTAITGTATAGAATSVTAPGTMVLTDVKSGWNVSVYDGTGRGQVRTVSGVIGQVVSVTAAWTTNPDSTSKICIWNPDEQYQSWYRMTQVRFNSKEWPDIMEFSTRWSGTYGMRIRLIYAARPLDMTTDASTTIVPEEYIIDKAMAFLYDGRMGDTRVDRSRFAQLAQEREQRAEIYARKRAFRISDIPMWQEHEQAGPRRSMDTNPLGW